MAVFVRKSLPGKKLLKNRVVVVVYISPTFNSFTYPVMRQLDFSSVLTSAFSTASMADPHTERHAVGMAWCQPLWGGGFCRNIRKVFALGDCSLWLGKWDICTHMEDKITKQELSNNPK